MGTYPVPTGLGNVFWSFAIDILSLTGQNPAYSQISDLALKSMECASLLAPSKAVASYRTPKEFAAHEHKRVLDEFENNAGQNKEAQNMGDDCFKDT